MLWKTRKVELLKEIKRDERDTTTKRSVWFWMLDARGLNATEGSTGVIDEHGWRRDYRSDPSFGSKLSFLNSVAFLWICMGISMVLGNCYFVSKCKGP